MLSLREIGDHIEVAQVLQRYFRSMDEKDYDLLEAVFTPDGEQNTWVVYGFYRDLFLRTPKGWRIPERYFKGVHFEGTLLPFDRVQRFPLPPWL